MVDARFPASEQDAPCMSPPGRMSELRDRAQRLRFELPEIAAKADAENTDSRDSMRRIWEEGLFDIHLPVRYDGVADAEPSRFAEDYFAILLDLVSGDSSAGMAFAVHSMVTMEIFDRNNGLPEETKAEIARQVRQHGVRFVASNSQAGSARPVSARHVDGGIVVSGVKTFNTNSGGGGIANVGLTVEGADNTGLLPWHALVPLDQPGVNCRHDWDVMGQRGTHSQTIE